VVTSKPLHRAVPLLGRLGTPFAVVRALGDGRGKPAPDPLLRAVLELGVDPAQAVYVGDMAVDQEAAERAGMHFVLADWGYGDPGAVPPLTARTPADLLRLLAEAAPCPTAAGRPR
jgi:phosphoglycolate phosphatase-like HAD superfamily hydrolase